jgi:hypothetical protein
MHGVFLCGQPAVQRHVHTLVYEAHDTMLEDHCKPCRRA